MFKKHPKGLAVLFSVEMWERFGFYIMSAVYVLYMDKVLQFDDQRKGTLYGVFLAAAYLFPLVGGWLGDGLLGQLATIRIGLWMMALGYIGLTVSSPQLIAPFYVGLILIAVGTGIFKVNMSVLVGNLYRNKQELRDTGFNIYYMGVNVGATLGPLAATLIGAFFNNYNIAFLAAALGMGLAIIAMEAGKKYLRQADSNSATVKAQIRQNNKDIDQKEFWQRILVLIVLFVIASLFWMPFYQNGMALTLFADRSTVAYKFLRPETYVMFNAIFILLLTPPLLAVFARMRVKSREPSTPVKIFFGMIIMAVAMGIMVWASLSGGDADKPMMSPAWLITTYLFITLAEILISPMGQSYVSKVAPQRIQGLMMGAWFGSTALGAFSSGIFGRFYSSISHHEYFLLLMGLSLFAGVLVLLFMKPLKRFAG